MSSPADICIFGGSAGGGKSWATCFDPMRWISDPRYTALIVREYLIDVKQAGGLWAEASALYPLLGGESNKQEWTWRFPTGSTIQFGHLDGDYQKRYRGAQVVGLYFEELADIEEDRFWYLLSRNRRRSGCAVRPYVRGTCNPDADSFLAPLLQWWWDPETGYSIPERSGKIRWMVRHDGQVHWAATRERLLAACPWAEEAQCKSVQYIHARLSDNRYQGSEYRGSLLNLDEVQMERLLRGNWKIRYHKGAIFHREWFLDEHRRIRCIDEAPPDTIWCRAWDLGATGEAEARQAGGEYSFTAGVLVGLHRPTRRVILGPLVHGRWEPGEVEDQVQRTAADDRARFGAVRQWLCREKAGAGKAQLHRFVRLLAGHDADGDSESGPKATRLAPLAAQAQHRNVVFLEDPTNERQLGLLEGLPARKAEDYGDAVSAAFEQVTSGLHLVTPAQMQEVVQANPELARLDQGGPRLGATPRQDLGRGRFRL